MSRRSPRGAEESRSTVGRERGDAIPSEDYCRGAPDLASIAIDAVFAE
ncbi:MAG TPA: hypothetical protein VMG40_18085 [Bryobacteraceae bacterium]|nr:hypothetical protein [Bryobacteraceae bacterium]